MKNTIVIIVLGMLLLSCTTSSNGRTTVSVLHDITENDFIVVPTYTALVSELKLEDNLWDHHRFRYGYLTDIKHNNRYEIYIDKQTALFGNDFQRKKEISAIKKGIKSVLENPKDSLGHNHSSIWEPLVQEIYELQKDNLHRSTLYVYSDLRENNADWFSIYRNSDSLLLAHNPKQVERLYLDKATSLNPSDLVKVIVVFQPRTIAEDTSFTQISQLYKGVFAELNIPIEFVANLNTQKL